MAKYLMPILTKSIIAVVALLHVYFLIIEMFLWTKPKGLMVFNQSYEKAKASEILAANQGLYNGFLAAGLIWGLIHPTIEFSTQICVFFLSCVIIAGLYGAYSVNKKIFFIQSLPAIISFVMILA